MILRALIGRIKMITAKLLSLRDYYEKKRKEETIVQVRDGRVMTNAAIS